MANARADLTWQMHRLIFSFYVSMCHKHVFWREIKTSAHLPHCQDPTEGQIPALKPRYVPDPRGEGGNTNDWYIIPSHFQYKSGV